MRLSGTYLFQSLWVAFLLYWQLMSINVKATKRIEPLASRMLRVVMFFVAIVLLSWGSVPFRWLRLPILPDGEWRFYVGLGMTVAGLLFAVWARVHLGKNWSRSVTVKQNHELITSGPYALVRHPIYTGLLTGFVGTAIAIGELRALIALLILFTALWIKLRLEEQWMQAQFGNTYAVYSSQVAALVPFVL
jgi:protein-S-isoprenylcysteine O-methyltransferase Ste14